MSKIPSIGILVFLGLYIYSTTLYPGGSQASIHSEGFDWINNYWCNVMNETAVNGRPNSGRPYSILSLIILCISLIFFFIQFADAYSKNKLWKRIIKISAVLSLGSAILIFTKYHDMMIGVSSLFGIFLLIAVIREIYKRKMPILQISGALCILLLGMNNFIYYAQNYLEILPLLQKITLALVLSWIMVLNYEIIKREENRH